MSPNPHQLTTTRHQIIQGANIGILERSHRRPDGAGKGTQNRRIDPVGLRQFTGCLGKVAGLTRIDDRHRQARCGQFGRQASLQTTGCLHHDQRRRHCVQTLANCGDTGIVIGDMNTFPDRIKPEIQRALGNVNANESFFLNRVHMHTHPCKNAGLLAQATVRVMNEKRHDALRSCTGLVPQEKTSCHAQTKNRAVDLRTIRLRRTGALAVDNNEPVIHRAPLYPQAPQPVTIFLYL